MNIVERIKLLAENRHMTLKQLAIELGFGENSIYRWNKNKPSLTNVEKVADYFNVSSDYLLGRSDEVTNADNLVAQDEFQQFFKLNTQGMTNEEKEVLKKEWKEYLIFRKNVMKDK